MNLNPYEIRDRCRRNLNKYTIEAFSSIPPIDKPLILDMGCGTGVPTLALTKISNGRIYAVDSDDSCLLWLEEKVKALNCADRIKVIHASAFDENLFSEKFDIVLAEGLLNVIGFEQGMPVLIKHLKDNGYLIIHDEFKSGGEKRALFKKYNLELLNSFVLDENVWWDDYYRCLEKSISKENEELFEREINEIIQFKKNPEIFRSIYYVLKK
ncbi:MAG: class I SAM-dependent methyltransferase [Syntrophomonadaceae bacterium]|nr:class I SAM-dependent methyltransferase [Syntrophomonadaceae bacterium]